MAKLHMKEQSTATKVGITILVLFGLAVVATLVAAMILLLSGTASLDGNIAVIPVEGVLLATGDTYGDVAGSDTIIADIETAEEDDAIEAVIFRINSPGGSAVASDEVATAIARMQKPSVAVIREAGASGAYWVASSTDHVVANPMSITGSIGVVSSYLSFGRFLNHWNVTYNQLIAGDRKDLGTPLRELEPAERRFLQEKLDAIHEYFIAAVAANRNMTVDDVRPLADGRFFLGMEAQEAGLVDELGGEAEALAWLNATHGITGTTVVYEHEPSLLEVLSQFGATQEFSPATALQRAADDAAVPMAR